MSTNLDKLHPIMRAALAKESWRYAMELPFRVGDTVYATDGRIMAWQPASTIDPSVTLSPPDAKVPDVESVTRIPATYEAKPLVLPAIPPPDKNPCESCEGTGKWGENLCEECGGDRFYLSYSTVDFGGLLLNSRYLQMLADAGASVYAQAGRKRGGAPVRFECGDVRGVLMPMSDRYGEPAKAIDAKAGNEPGARP